MLINNTYFANDLNKIKQKEPSLSAQIHLLELGEGDSILKLTPLFSHYKVNVSTY